MTQRVDPAETPISRVFGRPRAFLPVLHLPRGPEGAFESADIAVRAGADGVFLINQGMRAPELLALLPRLRERHPALWLGVNLLGWEPADVIRVAERDLIDGIWSDDAGVDALDEDEAARAAADLREARAETGWSGLYFGGTAFKTQAEVPLDRLGEVGRRAAAFVDVVTTSGPGTGVAADPGRVRILREALGAHPMGLASGVTPDNVGAYLPDVQAYLVATGIELEFGRLDEERTRRLAERIHGGA
jgi:hypothetical protein